MNESVFGEGDLVEGRVIGMEADRVDVALPNGKKGSIPLGELGAPVHMDDSVQVLVEQCVSGVYVVSREKADRLLLWRNLVTLFESQGEVEGEIVGRQEGGFGVDIGVRAFLPASQLELHPVRDPLAYVGERFRFRVIKFHKNRGNVVLSRRILLEEARLSALENLRVGQVVDGVVKSFAEYGAFIDIGGIQGLLHNTDMSWGRVHHPSEIVTLGDPVRLKVLKIDADKNRISLGLRQMADDPWQDVHKKYPVGNAVQGQVVSITDYGVFLKLEPGVEGLVHTTGPFAPSGRELIRKVTIGDELEAVVIETDPASKRISLRLPT